MSDKKENEGPQKIFGASGDLDGDRNIPSLVEQSLGDFTPLPPHEEWD